MTREPSCPAATGPTRSTATSSRQFASTEKTGKRFKSTWARAVRLRCDHTRKNTSVSCRGQRCPKTERCWRFYRSTYAYSRKRTKATSQKSTDRTSKRRTSRISLWFTGSRPKSTEINTNYCPVNFCSRPHVYSHSLTFWKRITIQKTFYHSSKASSSFLKECCLRRGPWNPKDTRQSSWNRTYLNSKMSRKR